MMKKVSLSQLLSRSPRHGAGNSNLVKRRASSSSGSNFSTKEVATIGEMISHTVSPDPSNLPSNNTTLINDSPVHEPFSTKDRSPIKVKSKGGILQTIKNKISGKLDNLQCSSVNSPKKSKSYEGLSNSFGDSFSQSISEESSSDGLNNCGNQSLKIKHSKRSIRPINTPVTRQNSLSHVLADPEEIGNYGSVMKDNNINLNGSDSLSPQTRVAALPLKNKSNYISGSSPISSTSPASLSANYGKYENIPRVYVESVEGNSNVSESSNAMKNIYNDSEMNCSSSQTPSPQTFIKLGDSNLHDFDEHSEYNKKSITEELFQLANFGWYWGPITRAEAEEKLANQQDGAFLVRDSSDDRYLLSLSFRSFGKTLHTRIEHSNGWFSFYPHPEHEGQTSLVGLINHCMSHSETGVFCYSRARVPGSPSFPVRLVKPVSRFTQVRTLQYLCRFVIRQYTRVDHIQALPLPSRIKGYLEEGPY